MGTDIHAVFQKKTDGGWEDVKSEYDEGRHYLLFAWLGGVRNGYGVAGVRAHTEVLPLSCCRGYPGDFQVEDDLHRIPNNSFRGGKAKHYTEADGDPKHPDYLRKWMGEHSHSWLSADEILSAKPPKVLRAGAIGVGEFMAWDGKSSPSSCCGGVSGPRAVVSDPSEINERTTHVQVEWFVDCGEEFKYFLDEVERLKEEHGEVRMVFGFDS